MSIAIIKPHKSYESYGSAAETFQKRNICNRYCSQAAYELVTQMFLAEGKIVFDSLIDLKDETLPNLSEERTVIFNKFLEMPLEAMKPISEYKAEDVFIKAAKTIENLSGVIFDE